MDAPAPPGITTESQDQRDRSDSFAKSAARASVAAPIVAWVLGKLDAEMGKEDQTTAIILLGIHWSLIGIGVISACVALFMLRRRRTRGVLVPAVVGLLSNALAVCAIAYFFLGPRSHSLPKWNPAEAKWRQHDSAEGGFGVLLPEGAVEKEIDVGSVVQHQLYVELPDESGYGVTWVDPPVLSERMEESGVQQLLDASVDRQIRKDDEVLDRHSVSMDGHLGREFRVKRSGKHGPVVLVERTCAVGRRVFSVLAELAAGEQSERAAEVNRFLDSFRVNKR